MNVNFSLEEEDVRAVIRLMGEVASSEGDHTAKKRQLMEGLCRIIDADAWVWGLGHHTQPGQTPAFVGMLHGGFTDETYAALTRAYEHPGMAAPQSKFAAEVADRKTHLTRLRSQIDPYDDYRKTGAFEFWQKAGINGVIMSMRPMDQLSFSVTTVYRRLSAPIFSERDNRLAHIVFTGVPWLHAQGWPEDRGVSLPRLSSRQRMTMNLLIQGYTRGEIAGHLEISPHTVNDYVKDVFNHFSVHSQAELISRFRNGDGGDR